TGAATPHIYAPSRHDALPIYYFVTLFSVALTDRPHIPVICVDGPTASGKGTLASEVARRLGYHYLASGALYRIAGLAAGRAGLRSEEHTSELKSRGDVVCRLG